MAYNTRSQRKTRRAIARGTSAKGGIKCPKKMKGKPCPKKGAKVVSGSKLQPKVKHKPKDVKVKKKRFPKPRGYTPTPKF